MNLQRRLQDGQLERRRSKRFLIELEVRYRVQGQGPVCIEDVGQTFNISSSGVLFSTQHVLDPGTPVELSIAWPARLENTHPLQLIVSGVVARRESRGLAVEIQRYEFHLVRSSDNGVGARLKPLNSGNTQGNAIVP